MTTLSSTYAMFLQHVAITMHPYCSITWMISFEVSEEQDLYWKEFGCHHVWNSQLEYKSIHYIVFSFTMLSSINDYIQSIDIVTH